MPGRSQPAGARRPRVTVIAIASVAVLGLLAAAPGSALAAPCGDDGGDVLLFDPGGYRFDFGEATSPAPDRSDSFATLSDGGSNSPGMTPPGPRLSGDAYDNWGALFVGGTGDEDAYYSANNDLCSTEEGGAEQVFPSLVVNDLVVQRKIYAAPAGTPGGLPGVRILNVIRNPTEFIVDTAVQVGDTQTASGRGDLGSDAETAVRSSSSGDLAAGAADDWFVTSDHGSSGGAKNDDPALAHVIDGPGGLDGADLVTLQGTAGADTTKNDNLAYGWSDLKLQPGETATFLSYETQAVTPTASAAGGDALAAAEAQQIEAATPAQLYAGMSELEIASLRNWNDLEIEASLRAERKQKLGRKLEVELSCPVEACEAELSGSIAVGGKRFALERKTLTVRSAGSTKVAIKTKSRKTVKKVKAAVDRKPAHGAKATFEAKVTDLQGLATKKSSDGSKLKVG